jgi:hypothetical protein
MPDGKITTRQQDQIPLVSGWKSIRHSPMCNCTSWMRHLAQACNPNSPWWLWIAPARARPGMMPEFDAARCTASGERPEPATRNQAPAMAKGKILSGDAAAGLKPFGDFGQHADRGLAGHRRLPIPGLCQQRCGGTAARLRVGRGRHADEDGGIGKRIEPKRNRSCRRPRAHCRVGAIGLDGAVDDFGGSRRILSSDQIAAHRQLSGTQAE